MINNNNIVANNNNIGMKKKSWMVQFSRKINVSLNCQLKETIYTTRWFTDIDNVSLDVLHSFA